LSLSRVVQCHASQEFAICLLEVAVECPVLQITDCVCPGVDHWIVIKMAPLTVLKGDIKKLRSEAVSNALLELINLRVHEVLSARAQIVSVKEAVGPDLLAEDEALS
jgi:hypothetical protein